MVEDTVVREHEDGDLPLPAPPDGYVARHPTDDDLDRVVRLYNLCDLDRIGVATHQREDVELRWVEPERLEDALVVEPADVPAGDEVPLAGYAEFHEDRDPWLGELDLYLEGRVDPRHLGHGIASFLLARGERRARVAARRAGEPVVTLQTTTANEDERARRFYVRNGFEPVRHMLSLRLDLDEVTDDEPAAPAGVRLRVFEPEHDAEALWAAMQDAFSDHWDFVATPFQEWRALEIDRVEDFDPSLWLLAVADTAVPGGERGGDEVIVGGALGRLGMPEDGHLGYVRSLAVRPAWRRHGVATFLLRSAFQACARAGATRMGLEVDDDTEEGALRLYEAAGMHVARRLDVYVKDVVA